MISRSLIQFAQRYSQIWGGIIVVALSSFFSIAFLNLPGKWWYEDDPGLYYRVSLITDPTAIFTNPDLLRTFATGKALVPMQMLSYWIDVHLLGNNPYVAYIHNIIAFVATTVALYATLKIWTDNVIAGIGGAILWMILPSTIAVHYFISARHYIEGLFFTILACLFVEYFCNTPRDRKQSYLIYIIVAILGLCAVLSKEIYVTTLPAFLFLVGIRRRQFALMILAIGLVLFYSTYRFWVLGSDLTYTEQLLGFTDYLHFLVVLPYTLTVGGAGYILYVSIGILAIWMIARQKQKGIEITIFALLILIAALISIYAVAYAVLVTYQTPGTWYRVPLIVNTILIFWLVYMIVTIFPVRTQIILLIITGLLIIPGTRSTQALWSERMLRAELEGKFYLDHPDKLLYSEEDAWWYIMGIHALYNISEEHYINKQMPTSEHARLMVDRYPIIYRYQKGDFISDEILYKHILQETRK